MTKARSHARQIVEVEHGFMYTLQHATTGTYLAGTASHPFMVVHRLQSRMFDSSTGLKSWMTRYETNGRSELTLYGTSASYMRGTWVKSPKESIENYNVLCFDFEGKLQHTVGVGELRQRFVKLPH